jgi:hypothetical protein
MLLSYRQIAGAIYYRSDDHSVLRFRIKAEKRRARTRNSGEIPKPSKMTQSRARTASLAGAGAPSRRGTECWIRTTWLHVRMGDDNILAEKEFDISLDGQTHKVKSLGNVPRT